MFSRWPLRRINLHGWETPFALAGIVLLSYGLWIPWMGLFGNDVPYLWYYHLLGPWGPGEFASIDRPISAVFYAFSTFLLGESVPLYHVFLLVLRWLSAVLFWWVLKLIWPERSWEAGLAAAFLSVYPGFRQNPVALEFILHFFVLALFLLSLAANLQMAAEGAAGSGRKRAALTALAVFGTAGLFSNEYFIGLEALRPVFLWIVTRRLGLSGKAQWRRIFAAWVPSLAVVAAFLFWRVVIFSFPTYRPVLLENLRANPGAALIDLAGTVVQSLWTALPAAWLQALHFPTGPRSLLVFGLLAAAVVGIVCLLMRRGEAAALQVGREYWGELAFAIGLLAMLAGGSIFWLTAIPIALEFPWDRSTLSLMPGASLALAGLLVMLVNHRYRLATAAVLLGLAVGLHFVNAQEYRAEWQKLQDFTWQLSWRAPALEPGTLLLFDVIPLNRYSDNDLTALLNWTYAPALEGRSIPYKTMDLTLRLDSVHPGLPGLEKDLPVEITHRGLTFQSDTSQTLAILYNPPACLKILAPQDALLPDLPERIQRVLPLTSLEQIHATGEAAVPPAQLGAEPAHGWCYYFQKAELAGQLGDWPEAVSLGDEAFAAGYGPEALSELLPFIQAYAYTGNIDRATQLTGDAAAQAGLQPALCGLWQQAVRQGVNAERAEEVRTKLNCQQD